MLRIFRKKQTNAPISVEEVRRECMENGISQKLICAENLGKLYGRLNRFDFAPDFHLLKEILAPKPRGVPRRDYPVLAVMVETREHPALVPIVLNMIETLAVPVQLFHGPGNKAYIENSPLKALIERGDIVLSALKTDILNAKAYNTLLLAKEFWQQLVSRGKVLIFQTDSILCGNSDYTLESFMEFDYIGSKWKRQRPVGLLLDGGNGGLSLRDWGVSYECLRRFPAQLWPAAEDAYYAFHMDLIGAKVGRDTDCARFGTQDEFLTRSFGAHQIKRLSQKDREAFLQYCEQAKLLL